ncbi:3-methyl-2-oxobutanoate hydroxymethyltransferase [Candidatus Fermentibacteria bacterium]|nr:3-methyl-2-oxobutanoate hydroxymethyltransferase [Candidatus Fermentibacteria bacterium]
MLVEERRGGTILHLRDLKKRGERIVALTAYDCPTARAEEEAGVDFILVGDSMVMAVMGEDTTLGATMDLLVAHTKAVRRGAPGTLTVGDMPFGSYQASVEDAVRNASRFLSEGGADAVKLEGAGPRILERVCALVESGIPVMGHVGLLPQSVKTTGGYRVTPASATDRLVNEARALEAAGVFALVIESVEEAVGRDVTASVSIPTIGIGAGRFTDGQILVASDMLGLTPGFEPRFLRRYAQLYDAMVGAVRSYAADVRSGGFPGRGQVYSPTGEDSR